MTAFRALGIAIAVSGGVFLVMGLNAPDAPVEQVEQVSEALTGSYANHTLWYITGGIGAMVAGVCMVLTPRR